MFFCTNIRLNTGQRNEHALRWVTTTMHRKSAAANTISAGYIPVIQPCLQVQSCYRSQLASLGFLPKQQLTCVQPEITNKAPVNARFESTSNQVCYKLCRDSNKNGKQAAPATAAQTRSVPCPLVPIFRLPARTPIAASVGLETLTFPYMPPPHV